MFVRGSRWISQRRPVAANGREHSLGVGNEQIGDEHVGMLRREIVGREAPQKGSPSGSESRSCPHRLQSRRPTHGCHQGLADRDQRHVPSILSPPHRKVPVHDRAGSFQHVHREIGPVRENATYPLRMDVHAPSRRIEVLVGQSQKKIPKAGRIEDVGVEQRRWKGHRLLQAEFLIRGSQFVQRLAATGFGLATVVKDVLGAMRRCGAYLPAGDPSFVEQLNQVRSRYL